MTNDEENDWRLPWSASVDRAIDRVCWGVVIFALAYFSWHVLKAVA